MLITNSRIRSFNIYLLPFILFVTSYLVFGFYYGSSDDGMTEALIRGVFFSHPVAEFFAFHRITAVLYARLYQLFPSIPWYGIFMHALLFLAITNYFVLIHRHVEKFITNYALLTPLLVIFYLVCFLDGVIFITFTKVSTLLAASSILLIIDGKLKAEEIQRPRYRHAGWYFLLFVLAFLTRPQAGILCIILLLPFAVLYNPTKEGFSRAGCLFVALISVVGFLRGYDYRTATEGSRYYWSVSPYVLNIYDYRYEGKNLDGPQDSMKYGAVMGGVLGDREAINVDFLSRISTDQLVDVGRLHPIELAKAVRTMGGVISPYQLLMVVVVIIAGFGVLIFYRHELPFIFSVNFLVFSLFYWSVVILLATFLKIPDRVLSPVVIAYITICILFISSFLAYLYPKVSKASHRFSASDNVITSVWILTLLVLVFVGYGKLRGWIASDTKLVAHNIVQASRLRQVINGELAGKIVVFTFNASQSIVGHPSLLPAGGLSANNRYMLLEGWPTWLPEYPRHLKEVTGSDRLSDVFDFLLKNREKVVFVSTPKRNAFIQEYFAVIYNNEFTFEEFKPRTMPIGWVGATQADKENPPGFYTINANHDRPQATAN